jgi:hypothetical protein
LGAGSLPLPDLSTAGNSPDRLGREAPNGGLYAPLLCAGSAGASHFQRSLSYCSPCCMIF